MFVLDNWACQWWNDNWSWNGILKILPSLYMFAIHWCFSWNRFVAFIFNINIIYDRANMIPLSELIVSIAMFCDGDSNLAGWITLVFDVKAYLLGFST